MEHTDIPKKGEEKEQPPKNEPLIPSDGTKDEDKTTDGTYKGDYIYCKENPKWEFWKKFSFPVVIQIILAIGTIAAPIAYIIISGHQNKMTRDAFKYTMESDSMKRLFDASDKIIAQANVESANRLTEKGIDISEKSVDYTKQFDSASKEFRKIELRAYVYMKDVHINEFLKDKDFKVKFTLENEGRTPAKLTRTDFTFKKNTRKLYETDWNAVRKYDTTAGFNLPPGIPRMGEFSDNPNINYDDSVRIVKKISIFFIYGFVFYDDVFGIHHEIRYVFGYDPDRKDFLYQDIKEPEK